MTRTFFPGMGQAVAERTILRRVQDGSDRFETWAEVASRVALGNSLLCPNLDDQQSEYEKLHDHLSRVTITMSGRHLQHGDATQPLRAQEVLTNCATAATSFMTFYLLMNGSGVGRCYDDDLMVVDFSLAPNILCVLDERHPDFNYEIHTSKQVAEHRYRGGKGVAWFEVPDSREGWAKAVELFELLAFGRSHFDSLLILDFSSVRCKGSPIGGMQNRPASGPVPLMNAMMNIASLKGSHLPLWKQAMIVDHHLAECVLVGGARRSARMSVKSWRDASILDYIQIKRPLAFYGKSVEEVADLRKQNSHSSFLWSSNNSVLVDRDFWSRVRSEDTSDPMTLHAKKVFDLVTACAYGDGTGEPGLINQDLLVERNDGLEELFADRDKAIIGSPKYQISGATLRFIDRIVDIVRHRQNSMITNPCGEVALHLLGAFCVIGDACPYFAETLNDAEDAIRTLTRSLIRVNLMDSVYAREVKRTNRIGVAMTGVHEFAWKFFGFDFFDLIDESKSREFWLTLARFSRAVRDEATRYSKHLGLEIPHTMTTEKPSGSVSKLWGLTEGWHLPPMREYLRWVQFTKSSPLVAKYQACGYPTRELTQYKDTVIVGFPTAPLICQIGARVTLASEATPEQQYQWLRLGEKYWIRGTDEEGVPLDDDRGNQISYTLKYDPKQVSYERFRQVILENQPTVRCCSVMPKEEQSSYEYLPEEAISRERFVEISERIQEMTAKWGGFVAEEVDRAHVECSGNACPIDFQGR